MESSVSQTHPVIGLFSPDFLFKCDNLDAFEVFAIYNSPHTPANFIIQP